MTRPMVLVDQDDERDGHPEWCAGGHQCAAGRLPGGEHASIPEVWDTSIGRMIATRRRTSTGRGGHLELRIVVPLPDHEESAQHLSRRLVTAVYLTAAKVLRRQ